MIKKHLHITSLFALLLLISCSDKKENAVLYKEDKITYKDTTNTWLHTVSNYKEDKKNYVLVLNTFYDKKVIEKDYLAAAEALDIACLYLADSYDFNEAYMAKIKEFDTTYRSEVPALKTTFVDSYLANYYFDKADLKKASTYFKNITVLEPNNYASCYNIARAYYDLSYIHYIMGKQNLSLAANQKSFEYFSQIDNPKGLAFVYSNYANIYTAIGDKKRAIQNADKAIKAYKSIDNTYNVYIGLINKISIYDFLGDARKETLIDSVYQAFIVSNETSDILKIKLYDFKVENLVQENKLLQAKQIIDQLQPIVEKVGSEDLTNEFKIAKAQYEIQINPNYTNFEEIKNALPTLINNQQYEKVNMFYKLLKLNAIKNNDYKNALQYENEIQVIADSIGNITTRVKTAELNAIYQTEKKEQQIVLQNKTIINRNTTIALLVSLFIGLILILIVFLTKQKQKKLKLEKQTVQNYTKQLLEKTEEERKRIASDLHDSVSHELLSLKNSLEVKTDDTNKKIDAIINDIRIISRNLHPIMFDKVGLKSSIEQLVERAQSVNHFMVTAEINYNNTLTSSQELQIYRIIQEALSNIIKYSDALAAKITITEKVDFLSVIIKDNGKGFNVTETLHNSSAFGLHNIIERTRVIGGEAKIISDKNGTLITLEIKK